MGRKESEKDRGKRGNLIEKMLYKQKQLFFKLNGMLFEWDMGCFSVVKNCSIQS
jgi:hypothetical protein